MKPNDLLRAQCVALLTVLPATAQVDGGVPATMGAKPNGVLACAPDCMLDTSGCTS